MKIVQKFFQKEKYNGSNRFKNLKILIIYWVFIFSNCLPDQYSSESNLLHSLLLFPEDYQKIKLLKDRSVKKSKVKRKYDRVTLTSAATGKKVQANSKKPNGWLKVNGLSDTEFTKFNLYQEGDPNCITEGLIQIEPSAYPNYYWNWWLGGVGNYAYYPKYNDGSNALEIWLLQEGCLKSGDRVIFRDYDTIYNKYYFLTNWQGGTWNEYIFLWKEHLTSTREIFFVDFSTELEE
ncbi:sphingomyelinase C [Leptospira noguchii]|uniref:sphingomyelinase n=1 Tax=Leptospira noguchii TaxID=28182 RepID=UPI001F06B7BA|nr:sphingomyelinase C [Leptospira noguchii]MCH1913865.1 sphingomyelinase C [Leptospira noguchii]MCH1917610.1 sphingomyelinase C [Leptospira noguchii]UOG65921.1 sphingomyelinase C [Leptospira noguchii]